MFTLELSPRTTGVAASAFHPGIVASDIYRDSTVTRILAASWLPATTADPSTVDGGYFERLHRKELRGGQVSDRDLAARLWGWWSGSVLTVRRSGSCGTGFQDRRRV
jgi:hypothetical protein